MKKTFLKALCLICALTMTFSALVACQEETSSETTHDTDAGLHKVTFNSNGGSSIDSVDVYHDQAVAEPLPPTRENYIFHCWEHSGDRWIFEIKKITEDTTLDAVWIPAHEVFKLEPTEKPNEVLISGFLTQKELTVLTIPEVINGKTVVGFTDSAFENIHDSYTKKLIIPKTATRIGKRSFADISAVHIEFLGSVTTLGESAFEDCDHLENITLAEGITTIPFRCFFGATEIKIIDLPKGATTIQENAFSGCTSLSSVFLPSSLTTIEDAAFENVENLSSVIYEGSEEDFDKIDIASNNDELLDAKIYFYSEEEPKQKGNYWHYDKNDTPVLW